MPYKVIKYGLVSLFLFFIIIGAFLGGMVFGSEHHFFRSINQPDDLTTLFEPFWETWNIVHNEYVDQPVDDQLLMQGAIRGMLESLGDPHTAYMDPDQFKQLLIYQDGEYEGIGAWVDTSGEYLMIISPMPESPAEKAGLRTGDLVIAIDGEDMTGIDGNLVLRQILGPADTKVVLTIRREDEEDFDIEIMRAKITVPSVEGEILDDRIAYIQLLTYGEKTSEELQSTLKTLLSEKPQGMILDLRNNGGGYLTTAIEVVSEFLPADEVVMYEEMGDGSRHALKTKGGGLAEDIPLIVLVNEGTASASEITAGAIQDYDRGKLVGMKTFGKGSVQNVETLTNDAGGVRVTIARWLTPKFKLIHEVGLEPDYPIEYTEQDIETGRDPQLEKALELLADDSN